MEAWQGMLLALGALLVGALLPVLFQLKLTLRTLGATGDRLSVEASAALAAVTATAQRLDRLTARLEEGRRVDTLLEGVDSLSATIARLGDAARVASAVGAAVGPAITAAARSWSAARTEDGAGPERAGNGAGVHDRTEDVP
mgnify:CR=1 FL=1